MRKIQYTILFIILLLIVYIGLLALAIPQLIIQLFYDPCKKCKPIK